ncbi:MAG: ATP synthase subunit I [Burkholderiaceae bacterium]
MLTAVITQTVGTLIAGFIAWLVWGPIVGLSVVAGGGSIAIPNALLALRLIASRPEVGPIVFIIGEPIKIALSVLLLWAAVHWIEDLSWLGLISGLVLALKSLLLTPWIQGYLDRRQADRMVSKLVNAQTKSSD